MKCDELKQYEVFVTNPYNTGGSFREIAVLPADKVYESIKELKEENLSLKAKNIELQSFYDLHGNVDNYIDKLEAENKLLKEHIANGDVSRITRIDEVTELKQKLENVQASMYADVVDANMEVRRLKRALYKACYNWAHFAVSFFSSYATKDKWRKMEHKCLKKTEEYK